MTLQFRSWNTCFALLASLAVVSAAVGQSIVWTDQNARTIQKKDVSGGPAETIVQFPSSPTATQIHYDQMTAKFYYRQGSAFQRANLDGSNPETIPTSSVGSFTLNIDSRKLYWISGSADDTLNFSELDGSGAASHTYPNGVLITLEAFADNVFFGATAFFDKGVWRADADGSNEQYVRGTSEPYDLGYDPVDNKLYCAAINAIFRFSPDGTGFDFLQLPAWQTSAGPEEVVVDSRGRKVYWADRFAKVIQRSNLDWSNVEDFVTAGDAGNPSFEVVGLTIVYNSTPVADHGGPMGRTLSFYVPPPTPSGPLDSTAIRLTMLSLQHPDPPNVPAYPPPDFSAYESDTCTASGESNGCARWVGKPRVYLEAQDDAALGNFKAAKLQCTPFYHDWVAETAGSPINVVGGEIVPSSTYTIEILGSSCQGSEETCTDVSAPLTMTTRRWGDIAANFNPPSTTTQPDAIDITQLVSKVKYVPGAPSKAVAQLQPNVPELNADANALDIAAVVDAVKQRAYYFGGPCPCPSQAPCGPAMGSVPCTSPTACVTAFGTGALCVKTCAGGGNDGDPCINDSHCPGAGTCGNGYCRDRCGRCTP